MYRPDMSPYTNLRGELQPNVLAVGWLDELHAFPKGRVDAEILERILGLCFRPVNQTRGFHQSPFLQPSPMGYPVEYKGKRMLLGAAEVWVVAKDEGVTYAAPNL